MGTLSAPRCPPSDTAEINQGSRGNVVLRRCDLARSPPALERRLIAFPKAQDKASCRFKLAHWKRPGAVLCVTANFDRECPLWVISGHSPTFGRCLLYPQKQTLIERVAMSALCQ